MLTSKDWKWKSVSAFCFFMLVLTFSLVSCTEDDELSEGDEVPELLLGEWHGVGVDNPTVLTFNDNGTGQLLWPETEEDPEEVYEFDYVWQDQEDVKRIVMECDGKLMEWIVDELTATSLQVTDKDGEQLKFYRSHGGGPGPTPTGTSKFLTKILCMGMPYRTFEYDEKGRLTYIRELGEEGFSIGISYSKLTLTMETPDQNTVEVTDFQLNNDGYIFRWLQSGEIYSEFSYDKDGYLVKIENKYNGSFYNLVWEDGNLVNLTFYEPSDGLWKDYYSSTTYVYGKDKNKYGQFTEALGISWGHFFATGLFGKMPGNLPVSCEFYEKENGIVGDRMFFDVVYTLDSDGYILSENWNVNGQEVPFEYVYTSVETKGCYSGNLRLPDLLKNNPLRNWNRIRR